MATTARAVVVLDTDNSGFDDSGNFIWALASVNYYPLGSGVNKLTGLAVTTLPTDTQAQVLAKITDAVVNTAPQLGYMVARNAVLIPSYVRGQ